MPKSKAPIALEISDSGTGVGFKYDWSEPVGPFKDVRFVREDIADRWKWERDFILDYLKRDLCGFNTPTSINPKATSVKEEEWLERQRLAVIAQIEGPRMGIENETLADQYEFFGYGDAAFLECSRDRRDAFMRKVKYEFAHAAENDGVFRDGSTFNPDSPGEACMKDALAAKDRTESP